MNYKVILINFFIVVSCSPAKNNVSGKSSDKIKIDQLLLVKDIPVFLKISDDHNGQWSAILSDSLLKNGYRVVDSLKKASIVKEAFSWALSEPPDKLSENLKADPNYVQTTMGKAYPVLQQINLSFFNSDSVSFIYIKRYNEVYKRKVREWRIDYDVAASKSMIAGIIIDSLTERKKL